MTIKVIFSKRGFYHPVFGRLGHGDANRGNVYELPDAFRDPGMLPKSARIVEDDQLEEVLEANEQPKPVKPKVLDPDELSEITGAGKRPKAQSAQMRTAPKRKIK